MEGNATYICKYMPSLSPTFEEIKTYICQYCLKYIYKLKKSSNIKKIVIVSSTTGNGLKRIQNIVNAMNLKNVKYYEFEEYFLMKKGITEITIPISSAVLTRKAFIQDLVETFCQILIDAYKSNIETIIIEAHASYLLPNAMFVPNPLFSMIFFVPVSKIDIIYLFDDWYDTVYRIMYRQKSTKEKLTPGAFSGQTLDGRGPYRIDPILYLIWRALDVNLLMQLENTARIYNIPLQIRIFAVKHPKETYRRLIELVVEEKQHYEAYISHPITTFRKIKIIVDSLNITNKSKTTIALKDIPGVCDVIEETKRQLRAVCKNLIIYEPTTVDEYILVNKFSFFKRLCESNDPVAKKYCEIIKILCRFLNKCQGNSNESCMLVNTLMRIYELDENICDIIKNKNPQGALSGTVLSLVIDCYSRWPTLKDEIPILDIDNVNYLPSCSSECEESRLELIEPLRSLAGGEFIDKLIQEYVFLRPTNGHYILSLLEKLIKTQIELRDFFYVEQSNMLIVILPIIYWLSEPPITPTDSNYAYVNVEYLVRLSKGISAEIARALSMAKTVIYLLIPTPLDKLGDNIAVQMRYITEELRNISKTGHARIQLQASCINSKNTEKIYQLNKILKHCNPLKINRDENCKVENTELLECLEAFYSKLTTIVLDVLKHEREGPFGLMGEGTVELGIASHKDLEEKMCKIVKRSQ